MAISLAAPSGNATVAAAPVSRLQAEPAALDDCRGCHHPLVQHALWGCRLCPCDLLPCDQRPDPAGRLTCRGCHHALLVHELWGCRRCPCDLLPHRLQEV